MNRSRTMPHFPQSMSHLRHKAAVLGLNHFPGGSQNRSTDGCSMSAPNIARFLEGELDPEPRGNVVAHPLTRGHLRQAPSKPNGQALRSGTQPNRPDTRSGTIVTVTKKANAPRPHGRSARVKAELVAFRRRFLPAAAVLIAIPSLLLTAIVSESSRTSQFKEISPEAASTGLSAGTEQPVLRAPVPSSKVPEIVVTSPQRLEAKAGEDTKFAIAIDSAEALPERSLLAISALPEGTSFSEGRPYGMTGWSLRPDEIGELRLLLPKASGSYDMRIELLAGDGALLAHSETRLKISDGNKALATSADAPDSSEFTGSLAPTLPQDGIASESSDSSLKVTPVKTVEIESGTEGPRGAPRPALLASAQPAETSGSAEWVQVIRAVNLRPKPDKSSKTIEVAKKGAKLHVLARHKGWVQVSDPTTSVTGWVYGRFVKPAGPPA